ncbi:MAG: penicillin acylase family protein [Acidimicrobiia bacterium]
MRRLPTLALSLLLAVTVAAASPAEAEGEVTIVRDNYGVPHVFADTADELSTGTGTHRPRTGCGRASFSAAWARGRWPS